MTHRVCSHIEALPAGRVAPQTNEGCQECIALGADWVHLRLCLTCGHVGCCDNSPHRHARHHAHAENHPVIQSFQPGEAFVYCFTDDLFDEEPTGGYADAPAGPDRAHAVEGYNALKTTDWF